MKSVINIFETGKIKKMSCGMTLIVTLSTASLVMLIVSLAVDPILIFIKYYTRVTIGSRMHLMLQQETQSLLISTYLFNVTNGDSFLRGEDHRLKVQEVGPFTYREIRRHEDIEIDDEDQVLRYTPKVRLVFAPEESLGFPEEFNVTMPNLIMLGIVSKLSSWSFLARLPLNVILSDMKSKPLLTMDAKTYLWGYKDPLVTLANKLMPSVFTFDKIGILSQIYDPNSIKRLELSLADQEKFRIRRINGKKKLLMSEGENSDSCTQCDALEDAYEGIGFPPGFSPDLQVRIFKNGLCRLLPLEYNGTKRMDYGGDAFRYRFSDEFFASTRNTTGDGLVDFADCFFGVPVAVSRTHLQGVKPALYSKVEGMRPDEHQNGWAVIEPKLGIPLETVASIQMNLMMKEVSYNAQAKNFANSVIPIGYIKIVQPNLPEEFKANLLLVHSVAPRVLLSFQILLFLVILTSGIYMLRDVLITKNLLVPKRMRYGMVFPNVSAEKHTNLAYVDDEDVDDEPLLEMINLERS